MQKTNNFDLNVDQVSKLNRMLPRGYKIISIEQNIKRIAQLKKKSKIVYAPISQVLSLEKQKQKETVGRRNKTAVSYYQGGGQETGRSNRNVQDYYQTQKVTKVNKKQWSSYNNPSQKQPFLNKNMSLQMYLPPVFPSASSKTPLTAKQILQQIQKHSKFYVIQQYTLDCPDRTSYNILVQKSQNSSYNLNQLLMDLNDIFINIYEYYPKSSNIYNDSVELEIFSNQLISTQKNKSKSIQAANSYTQQSAPIVDNSSYYFPVSSSLPSNPPPAPAALSRQPSNTSSTNNLQLLRKKTIQPLKPDLKNITIIDKRILGQNIKKLPNQCLPQICKIVYQTLQTRQQYVIDIDMLPIKKVKQLQIYVMNCISRFGEQIYQQGGGAIDNFKNNNISGGGLGGNNGGNNGGGQAELTQESFVIQDDFD